MKKAALALISILLFSPLSLAAESPDYFSCEYYLDEPIVADEWQEVYFVDHSMFMMIYSGNTMSKDFALDFHIEGLRAGILPNLIDEGGFALDIMLNTLPDRKSQTLLDALEDQKIRLEGQGMDAVEGSARIVSQALGESFFLPVWVKKDRYKEIRDYFEDRGQHYRVFQTEEQLADVFRKAKDGNSKGPQIE